MKSSLLAKIMKSQWQLLKFYKLLLLTIYALSIASIAFSVLLARVNQDVIDNVFVALDLNHLIEMLPYIIAVFIMVISLETLNSYINAKLTASYTVDAQKDFYIKMVKASYRFVSSILPNDIYYRMFADTSAVTSFAYNIMLSIPISIITVVSLSVVILLWSWPMAIFVLLFILLQVVLVNLFRAPLRRATERYRLNEQIVATSVSGSFNIIDIIKTYGVELWQIGRLDKELNQLKNMTIQLAHNKAIYLSWHRH